MKYLPFLGGVYSTAPGLIAMPKAANPVDRLVFHLDTTYKAYLANKRACREENIHKYVIEKDFSRATAFQVNQFLAEQMVLEYPDTFKLTRQPGRYRFLNRVTGNTLEWADDWCLAQDPAYLSLFDGLCCQLPEDVAVCQLSPGHDRMAAIHLCAPNHWAAADKAGKPFDAVHAAVPDMEKTLQHYPKMLETLVHKGPFTRFAWGLATDSRLNHHPEAPPGQDPQAWQGRQLSPETTDLYVRVERQNMVGLPSVNAFLFTIRTYFYSIQDLEAVEKAALLKAVTGMSPASLHYKGLTGALELLRQRLS
jgi:hypothetical protein